MIGGSIYQHCLPGMPLIREQGPNQRQHQGATMILGFTCSKKSRFRVSIHLIVFWEYLQLHIAKVAVVGFRPFKSAVCNFEL